MWPGGVFSREEVLHMKQMKTEQLHEASVRVQREEQTAIYAATIISLWGGQKWWWWPCWYLI